MSEQSPRITPADQQKKTYRKPTAQKTRLENIVAGQGSCNVDLGGLRDQGCNRPQ